MGCVVLPEQITLQENSKYRVGAVTYEVVALFYEEGQNLRDKMQHLILQDVRKNVNRTFADKRDNVVK